MNKQQGRCLIFLKKNCYRVGRENHKLNCKETFEANHISQSECLHSKHLFIHIINFKNYIFSLVPNIVVTVDLGLQVKRRALILAQVFPNTNGCSIIFQSTITGSSWGWDA